MDPIDPGFLNRPFLPRREDKKTGRSASASKSGFLRELRRVEEPEAANPDGRISAADADLEKLLDEVHEAGRDLIAYPGPENVQVYKDKIRRFVRTVVDRAVTLVEVEGRLRKDMKRPKYALLQIIDEKLEKLGAYVLSEQREKLELLRRVDELHGLLIDLKQ